jgi:hypothetical protein
MSHERAVRLPSPGARANGLVRFLCGERAA